MNSGVLSCPKCGELRMDNFDHWESRLNAYNQTQWLFYKTIVIKKGWKCWALLTCCSNNLPKKWYDPCDLCFNPCRYDGPRTVTVKTDIYGNKVVEDDSWFVCFCIMMKCLFFYMLCYLTYFFYFFIFIWYDIYYCIFKEDVFYDVYFPNGIVRISENGEYGIWNNVPNEAFTEKYWNSLGLNIFRCNKCRFISNNFKDFIENENKRNMIYNGIEDVDSNINVNINNIPSENNVNKMPHENNDNNIPNENNDNNIPSKNNDKNIPVSNDNIISYENNLQNDAINVHFISEDKAINQLIQGSSTELFSNILEKFFGIYPDLRDKNCIFICNGQDMKPDLTLSQNNYNSGDEILIMIKG